MSPGRDYKDYVRDQRYFTHYDAYQQRYREDPRESDKVLIRLLRQALAGRTTPCVLDAGCSTGNLLYWMKQEMPSARLVGGDLAESSLERCRRDPALAGVTFQVTDLMALSQQSVFDAVTVNAVFYCLSEEQFTRAVENLARALKPGGVLLAFDLFHSFPDYRASVTEYSKTFPAGHQLNLRPWNQVEALLRQHGFGGIAFHPFVMPFDLPKQPDAPILTSYTRQEADGERLTFRGVLFQPWCHLVAKRA